MKVFAVAGEASGDRLGGAVLSELRTRVPEMQLAGVGGGLMEQAGLQSLFPMEELSVMGIAEVLPKYPALRRRMIQTADAAIEMAPDVLLTIDSPDFCLRVARRVKEARPETRIVHYVAPSVWAWRPKRATKMARSVDQVLCLLPFEPPYMEAAGMRADFVGHPVVTEPVATDAEVTAFREREGLVGAPLLLVLPGSRGSELNRLLPIFGAALKDLEGHVPGLRAVLPVAPGKMTIVQDGVRDWAVQPILVPPEDTNSKRAAFRAADVALAASGTVSLELAASGTPMVIAYDMSWLSWQIMSRAALIDTVTLVNLVSDTRAVPEFLGPACQAGPIAAAVADILNDPDTQNAQINAMKVTMERLGAGGPAPGALAADAILDGTQAHVSVR